GQRHAVGEGRVIGGRGPGGHVDIGGGRVDEGQRGELVGVGRGRGHPGRHLRPRGARVHVEGPEIDVRGQEVAPGDGGGRARGERAYCYLSRVDVARNGAPIGVEERGGEVAGRLRGK